MEITEILDVLPHRHPYLFVDRVIDIEARKRIVGIKNISANDPVFQGHFPNHPILPSPLIIETIAQVSMILLLTDSEFKGRKPLMTQIDNIEFKKQVIPGDQIRVEAEILKLKDDEIRIQGLALVDGKVICDGKFTFRLSQEPTRPQIHPTARVHETALLGKDVLVGPNTIIGEDVVIGDNTILEANVVVEKWTKIGENCHIHFGSIIGAPPQDLKYQGEKSWVTIGDNNEIREYVTINRATGKDQITKVGSHCLFLTNVHVAHNCEIGNEVVIANQTTLGGHTIIEDKANIGGMTGIHQFVRIGRGSMVGAYTRLPQDVPPYMLCEGNPAVIRSINLVGMKRREIPKEAINEIKDIYKTIYRSDKNMSQVVSEVSKIKSDHEETNHLISFIQAESIRGITKKSLKDSE
jgi:UDP-N-acetylglucosamine acyltransferase